LGIVVILLFLGFRVASFPSVSNAGLLVCRRRVLALTALLWRATAFLRLAKDLPAFRETEDRCRGFPTTRRLVNVTMWLTSSANY